MIIPCRMDRLLSFCLSSQKKRRQAFQEWGFQQ